MERQIVGFVIAIILVLIVIIAWEILEKVSSKKKEKKETAEFQFIFSSAPKPPRKTPNQIRAEFGFPPINMDKWNAACSSPMYMSKNEKIEYMGQRALKDIICEHWKSLYEKQTEELDKANEEIRQLKRVIATLPNCGDCPKRMYCPQASAMPHYNCPLHPKTTGELYVRPVRSSDARELGKQYTHCGPNYFKKEN